MAEPIGIPSLSAYLASLQPARLDSFAVGPATKVTRDASFEEMKAHVLQLYDRVDAPRSFVDDTGAIYDCIPIEQQPALRGVSGTVPKAPDLPHIDGATARPEYKDSMVGSPLKPGQKDHHGNEMHCPPGMIPMRRVTLETLSRFETLSDFFHKAPRGAGRPPRSSDPLTVPATHRWAHAFQNVNNGGGHSVLNLWAPPIGANQIFSLSQHWYVGGSGANLQTLECGWQVYPGLYGDARPHLFTYWTADNYNKTGCYNMSCSAFVQTSNTFTPGMALGPVSVSGGVQHFVELAYWHTGGRWWLYVNGTAGSNAVGYYPDTQYKGGALANHATEIDYGGETVGTTTFPPMGSGAFANQGWQKAAYQRTIGYWPPAGGAMINASLTPSQSWPNCYTAQVTNYAAPWLETLWFGGPGGNC